MESLLEADTREVYGLTLGGPRNSMGLGVKAYQLNSKLQIFVTDAELRSTVALGLGSRSRVRVLR